MREGWGAPRRARWDGSMTWGRSEGRGATGWVRLDGNVRCGRSEG